MLPWNANPTNFPGVNKRFKQSKQLMEDQTPAPGMNYTSE